METNKNKNTVILCVGGESISTFSLGCKWIPRTSRRMTFLGVCLFTALTLTGCIDRGQADAKLARACEAGVSVLLPEGERIDRVSQTKFMDSPTGGNHRHITLTAITDDGWGEEEAVYECIFEESFGFMNMNYTASVYQVRFDGRMIGKAGGKIVGEVAEMIKLTDAIRESLYE